MNNKWRPFILPISLFMMASPAFSQSSLVSNAAAGGDELKSVTSWFAPTDAVTAIFPPDSLMAHSFSGWYKQPGQMPILIPSPLPNSMPVLHPPEVDQEMIIPIAGVEADSLDRPHEHK